MMQRDKISKAFTAQTGFTITELLVSVAIGAIASILMVTAYVFSYGSLVAEQTETLMTLESQQFLRKMIEDVRVSNEVRTKNQIPDAYKPGPGTGGSEGWETSDPANILVVTQPAVDVDENFIYDPDTGFPYQNEIIYFGDASDNRMYRRVLANPDAVGNRAVTTCPSGTAGCPPDIELVTNLDNLLFGFYDIDDTLVTVAEQARSIEITVNLRRQLSGESIATTNTSRVTLRNEK